MNIVFYIIIFLIGACIGSFYATLTQRVIKEKRMFSIHSHCSKCGEKLRILEKLPIISYLLLKGKCKYCKKKIGTHYILLETLTAVLFVIAAYTFNLYEINLINIFSFLFVILYFSYIILAASLDYKQRTMPAMLLAYGIMISMFYMVYLLFTQSTTLLASTICLGIVAVLLLTNIITTKKRAQSNYIIDLLTMLLVMLIFTGEIVCILTITGTLLSVGLYILINKIRESKSKSKKAKKTYSLNMKIVYIMAILNIFIFLSIININN